MNLEHASRGVASPPCGSPNLWASATPNDEGFEPEQSRFVAHFNFLTLTPKHVSFTSYTYSFSSQFFSSLLVSCRFTSGVDCGLEITHCFSVWASTLKRMKQVCNILYVRFHRCAPWTSGPGIEVLAQKAETKRRSDSQRDGQNLTSFAG